MPDAMRLAAALANLEPTILDRWSARLAESGLLAGEEGAPDRAELAALVAEVRAELAPACAPGAVRITLVRAGAPAAVPKVATAEPDPGLRPRVLLALALGREVVVDVLAERMEGWDDVSAVALAAAFRRVFHRHGTVACARCRSDQDASRALVEDRLRTAIEHARDAILTFEPERGITAWNRGAEELFGLPSAAIEGRSLDTLLPNERARGTWARDLMREVGEQGHVRVPELELADGEGGRIWVDASFSRMRGPDGADVGVWAVFRDITEQRRLLQQSLDAERLALIGTMSAKFAHEIRNPLASIQLNVELIGDALRDRVAERGDQAGEDAELVRAIASEVQRIRNVVQEYLRFGRLPKVQRAEVEIDRMLERGLAVLAPELRDRAIEIKTDFQASGRVVLADAEQVWQAVHNLIGNAMDALPQGGNVELATRVVASGVRCEIRDDGPGIPPELKDKVFAPFFSTKHAGTGLGLPFARQVLAEHDADLELESSSRGTRFWFVLPFAAENRP
jgi:PAS domain S-box-containing protein